MSYISLFDSDAAAPIDGQLAEDLNKQLFGVATWHVEVMDGGGNWVPEPRRWLKPRPSYTSYVEAVEAAVSVWRRSDMPARPAAD